jgi:undecaprenyl-diphosphatase
VSLPDLVSAAVLGVVEGVTEFLPVSSTGHLIIAGDWLGFTGDRAKTFEVVIQVGAILAIVWLYLDRFLGVARTAAREPASRRFITNLVLGFLPAALLGLALHHWIKAHLFTPLVVGIAFIVGGFAILIIERWKPVATVKEATEITPGTALGIGLAQTLALIPGMSRSAATIMGGYALGLSRTAATEFSFFLAVPVLTAAAGLDLFKSLDVLSSADIPLFLVGLAVSFISAFVVVKSFLKYVAHHSFSAFAWYRIGFGVLLLVLYGRSGFPAL